MSVLNVYDMYKTPLIFTSHSCGPEKLSPKSLQYAKKKSVIVHEDA